MMQTSVTNLILFRDNFPMGAFFLPPNKETTLGRSNDNSIVLNDERCSRYHAALRTDGDRWFLKDQNSRNGTLVNDALIKEEVELKNGDRIQVGQQLLIFCITPMNQVQSDTGSDRMKYSLAVSDTLAVAASHFSEQKELTAQLDRAQNENKVLRSLLNKETEIIGKSRAMQELSFMIGRIAPSKATVLIRGESGVGKELVARAIHANSPRSKGSLICMNCAAISESLLESELFGHEKGAFTGATERKIGKFEAANGGTLFLDEIAEMAPGLQAKFLRVLEGQAFERVGGNKPISSDVRVIAATNRDLEAEVAAGRFRHDLFFRLHVMEIIVPPLRKHTEDIPTLAHFFLKKYSQETNRHFNGFYPDAMQVLEKYRWPGNVRELKNMIERAVLLGNKEKIAVEDLLLSSLNTTGGTQLHDAKIDFPFERIFTPKTLEENEREIILKTLNHFLWNKSHSAKALGIERTTLDRKIARYDLKRE